VKLYHTTPRWNVPGIKRSGIALRRGVCWLHTLRATRWAISHLATHHDCDVSDMVTLEVSVPRRWLCYVGGRVPGRWLCRIPIHHKRITWKSTSSRRG
jgi:hypothetical protein